jgi:HSP20 family molecular chaperone IbpA
MLSFSEQKLLLKVKKIKKDMEKLNVPLYIIHNLKSLNTVEQVEDYIQNTLLKSATFTLEKGHKVSTKINQNDGVYYYETTKEKDKSQQIYHLIYANESSLEVRHFNEFTLNFIERSYQNVTHLEPFDIIESIKDRYIKLSKDIIEKTEINDNLKLTKESFDDSDPSLIKLKSPDEIVLKKCLIDELGFSNLKANGFEPTYNIYKKDNKLIIRLEIPGNCGEIKSKIEPIDKYHVIKISGEKKKDIEPEKLEDNIYNKREIGKFLVEIPLKNEEYHISRQNPKFTDKKGVTIIEYYLDEKSNEAKYDPEKDEEI